MERLAFYQDCIQRLLQRHADGADDATAGIENQVIADTKNNHYQIMDVGWEGLKRVYNCFIHLDIKDGQVWIQRNMTEADLAQELSDMGVPKEDIILGLHPPYKRPYTGYGAA